MIASPTGGIVNIIGLRDDYDHLQYILDTCNSKYTRSIPNGNYSFIWVSSSDHVAFYSTIDPEGVRASVTLPKDLLRHIIEYILAKYDNRHKRRSKL